MHRVVSQQLLLSLMVILCPMHRAHWLTFMYHLSGDDQQITVACWVLTSLVESNPLASHVMQVHAAFKASLPQFDLTKFEELQDPTELYRRCWSRLPLTDGERSDGAVRRRARGAGGIISGGTSRNGTLITVMCMRKARLCYSCGRLSRMRIRRGRR